ncbi:MAG: BT_3928 family protein [Ferruginibacter sp.]
MKLTVTIARVLTGLLFIFSGLVKAIDPRGLAYKMQEFFEAWANDGFMKSMMQSLDHFALSFSIIMITLEVVVGVALLIGWQKRFTTWILLLLMLFFSFLTSYVLFSGKIRACGCFGDCIPLTPIQTFTKDIILLCLALLLLIKVKYITPVAKPFFSFLYILLATILTLMLQFHVLKHLPLADCLPYKKGNNILELMKMPADAVPDKYDYVFVYEKNGEKKDFSMSALPDSTWNFAERKQVLLQKGKNNIPAISDYSLSSDADNVTTSILSNPKEYYLVYMKDLPEHADNWITKFGRINKQAKEQGKEMYVVTAERAVIENFLKQNNITVDGLLTCDAIVIKTVARVNPTLYKMKGPVVQGKWAGADFDEVK